MKKILIASIAAAVIAVGADAEGMVVGASIGYADASTEATAGATTTKADANANTYGLSVGYEATSVRVGGYYNYSSINNSKDASSNGVYADYLIPYTETYKFYIGGQYGQGVQKSDVVDLDFKDVGVRGGVLIDFKPLELEIGVRKVWRDYDSVVVSGTTINSESDIINAYIGLNYKI